MEYVIEILKKIYPFQTYAIVIKKMANIKTLTFECILILKSKNHLITYITRSHSIFNTKANILGPKIKSHYSELRMFECQAIRG